MKILVFDTCFTNIEKKHISKFLILIVTIIIQINEKNTVENKIQTVQMIINQFNWGKK